MNDAFPIDVLPGFISVTNPFNGVEVGTVVSIPPEGAQVLIQTAKDGARACRNLSRHERARVLETCASLVERDKDAFADLIVAEAGGVMINDSSDYRFDAMPFGGFKYGSLGREGVRFAYEEMTQPKVVCIRKTICGSEAHAAMAAR